MGIKHATPATGTDAGTGEIHKAQWNADHVITGLSPAFIGASVYASADVNMATGGEAVVAMNSEVFDSDGFHDNSTNNGRFTVPAGLGGRYLVAWNIHTSSDPGAVGYVIIRKNNSAVISMSNVRWLGSHGTAVGSTIVDLAATDYVEMKSLATNGSVPMTGGSTWVPWFSIAKLDSGKVGAGIGAKVTNTAGTSMANASEVVIPWATEEFDTDGFHDNSTNNTRLTVPAGLAGKYLVMGQMAWSTGMSGSEPYVMIFKNGAGNYKAYFGRLAPATNSPGYQASVVLDLAAGDYVEFAAYQNTGSSKTLITTADFNWFSIMRLDSGSSSARAGDLLGVASLEHASVDTTVGSITSVTDFTGPLNITFVAPNSGNVVARISAPIALNTGSGTIYFRVREGSTTIKQAIVNQLPSGLVHPVAEWLITGLTPGTSYTYKPSISASDTSSYYHGPTYGAVVFTITSA